MAQLSDDCFAFGGELMRADEAMAILAGRTQTIAGTERVALRNAAGRILAADIVAARSVPPHDNAAVDGYAVHFDDLDPQADTRLPVQGRAAAGHPMEGVAARGTAARVFTGARMPAGPDTVFMQEDARIDGEFVILPPGQKRGANRRKAGEDIEAGRTVLCAGHRLRAQDIGLVASLGLAEIEVRRALRVAVFSTGDELREPGTPTPTGAVYDANRFALLALLEEAGFAATDLGILADRRDTVREALADAAATHDAVVTSGGMSTGDEDHVRAAVEAMGAIHFWRLAIRPGRPVAFGTVSGKAFVGLPGNPVAMMVTFLRFARPVLLRLAGADDPAPLSFRVRAGFDARKKAGRREWLRARLTRDADGMPVAHRFPRDGAGILTSLVESDGLVELAEDVTDIRAGTLVDFLPYSELAS
ncbi:MAG: molybdopterin molybdenumtransferase MoeA [Alphaproteobacteria bacterium]|nr:molybdopterin molybdenumtransferase MoeA [Alphaproteobacteria bacterium]